VYVLSAAAVVLYVHLDCLDGKQARRTNSSSPLGQLFDHGCDALSVHLLLACMSGSFGMTCNTTTAIGILGVKLPWVLAQWEEYHTGIMLYGNDYYGVLEANYSIALVHILTAIFGPGIWQVNCSALLPLDLGLGLEVLSRDVLTVVLVLTGLVQVHGQLSRVLTAGTGKLPAKVGRGSCCCCGGGGGGGSCGCGCCGRGTGGVRAAGLQRPAAAALLLLCQARPLSAKRRGGQEAAGGARRRPPALKAHTGGSEPLPPHPPPAPDLRPALHPATLHPLPSPNMLRSAAPSSWGAFRRWCTWRPSVCCWRWAPCGCWTASWCPGSAGAHRRRSTTACSLSLPGQLPPPNPPNPQTPTPWGLASAPRRAQPAAARPGPARCRAGLCRARLAWCTRWSAHS
jgi:phosphatidylglycerophosphate synthase